MSTVLMENGVLMYLKGLFYLWWRDERRFKVSTSPSLHSTPTNIEKLEKQEKRWNLLGNPRPTSGRNTTR